MSLIQALLHDPSIPKAARQSALDRVYTSPGLPDPKHTTQSFWFKNAHEISKHQSHTLPAEADVVIIGSGITGTAVAKTFLSSSASKNDQANASSPKVVILEARNICSGATGRNGGHILETVEDYIDLRTRYGATAAAKIVRFRLAHLDALTKVAADLDLLTASQIRKVQFLSVYFNGDRWDEAKETITAFKEDMPDDAAEWGLFDSQTMAKEHLIPGSCGAVYGTAGAVWPYRLITGVLSHLLKTYHSNFALEANTAVTSIEEVSTSSGTTASSDQSSGGKNYRYTIQTSRGPIKTNHVIHCTNGHAAHLLPGMQGNLFPVRGQMTAQESAKGFPNQASKHSWLFNYDVGYDYITQLPPASTAATKQERGFDGEMMIGGGFAQTMLHGLKEIGVASDDEQIPEALDHLRGSLGRAFEDQKKEWGKVAMAWTGTLGITSDALPWVGRVGESVTGRQDSRSSGSGGGVEDQDADGAEWIAAGFSGEGMVHAWLSGVAVAEMVLAQQAGRFDKEREETMMKRVLEWFPEEMLVSEKRLKESALPRKLSDITDDGEKLGEEAERTDRIMKL